MFDRTKKGKDSSYMQKTGSNVILICGSYFLIATLLRDCIEEVAVNNHIKVVVRIVRQTDLSGDFLETNRCCVKGLVLLDEVTTIKIDGNPVLMLSFDSIVVDHIEEECRKHNVSLLQIRSDYYNGDIEKLKNVTTEWLKEFL